MKLFLLLLFIQSHTSISLAQNSDSTVKIYPVFPIDTLKVIPPRETVSRVNLSGYLMIGLHKTGISATFKNKASSVSNTRELDEYLKSNIQKINKTKVEIDRFPESTVEQFKSVISIFAKHGITKFSLVTKE